LNALLLVMCATYPANIIINLIAHIYCVKSRNLDTFHYAVFSVLLLFLPSWVQVFF
jgi:hypothetical protein